MNEIEAFTARRGLPGPASTVSGPAPVITWSGTTIIVDGDPGPNLKGEQGIQGITRRQITFSVSDQNEVLQLGVIQKLFFDAPFSGTLTGFRLGADKASSCVVDVLKGGVSITASAKPTLNAQTGASSTTLTGWTTAFTTGERFTLQILSNNGANAINLILLAQEAV